MLLIEPFKMLAIVFKILPTADSAVNPPLLPSFIIIITSHFSQTNSETSDRTISAETR